MREKKSFRYEMERLDNAFPNRNILTMVETANYLGVTRQSVSKYIPRTPLGISKSSIAEFLTGSDEQ